MALNPVDYDRAMQAFMQPYQGLSREPELSNAIRR
jgi:hypothetical protein